MIVKENVVIDHETGEIIEMSQTTIKKVKAEEFIQVYTQDLCGVMKDITKTEMQVLVHLWNASSYLGDEDPGNMVVLNKPLFIKIKKDNDISESTVRNCLSSLKKKDVLLVKPEFRSIYYLNPKYFFKGSPKDRAKVYKRTIEYHIE